MTGTLSERLRHSLPPSSDVGAAKTFFFCQGDIETQIYSRFLLNALDNVPVMF
jgi:hypothetical protein